MTKPSRAYLIAGYYGFGNLGDELILSETIQMLLAKQPDARIVAVSGNVEATKNQHQVEAVDARDIHELSKAIESVDLVVVGGGGLFYDYWGVSETDVFSKTHSGINVYASIAMLASLHRKPLHVFAVGVGPLSTPAGAGLTRAIFEQAQFSSVRDKRSFKVLDTIGVAPEGFTRTLDPVMASIDRPNRDDGNQPHTLVAVRKWPFTVGWEKTVAQALDEFVEFSGASLRFVPFQVNDEKLLDDRRAAADIVALMKHSDRATLVDNPLSVEDAYAIFSEADFVIGMRLHSVVLAARYGIPFVALSYDEKVSSFVDELGMHNQSIDLDMLREEGASETLVNILRTTWAERNSISQTIRLAAEEMVSRHAGADELALSFDLASQYGPVNPRPIDVWVEVFSSLQKTILEKEKTYQALSSESEAKQVAFGKELEREWLRIEALSRQVDERDNAIKALEQSTAVLTENLEQIQSDLKVQQSTLRQVEEHDRWVSTELSHIKSSRGYRLLFRAWQLKKGLIPKGSRREKALASIAAMARATGRFAAAPISFLEKRFSWGSLKRKLAYGLPFYRFRRRRREQGVRSFEGLRASGTPGLVSIIMPVYNGQAYLAEAIDSVLAQTYEQFELIIVNDGSEDASAEIIETYRNIDQRIAVVEQENQKLPAALNQGFRIASGEFLTWTSHDNRLKPTFLESMVAGLIKNPRLDIVYADMDLIDTQGEAFKECELYRGYQVPAGSEHVFLPRHKLDIYTLNTQPNNFIGGAFMYRDRVPLLVGNYSPFQFTREDYEFWMRANAVFNIRHIMTAEPLYEYRVHPDSLTSRDKELGITKGRDQLMVFDDFRRDFLGNAAIWLIEAQGNPRAEALATKLRKLVKESGQLVWEPAGVEAPVESPYLPIAHVCIATSKELPTFEPRPDVPEWAVKVLLLADGGSAPDGVEWDICLAHLAETKGPLAPSGPRWGAAADLETLFSAIDVRVKTEFLQCLEEKADEDEKSKVQLSVVVCTYKRQNSLLKTLDSIAQQKLLSKSLEIIVVNNYPEDAGLKNAVSAHVDQNLLFRQLSISVVDCPLPGLANARNVGISQARGEIVVFVDDDATLDDGALSAFHEAFASDPALGVVGGHIYLQVPEINGIWTDDWKPYWSHFETDYKELTRVEHWWEFPWGANWAARKKALLKSGGFRSAYGRSGGDFNGGEEIVAASQVKQIGYEVAVLPQAAAKHHVETARISLSSLGKTIRAAMIVRHRATHNLHIEEQSSISDGTSKPNKRLIANLGERQSNSSPEAKFIENYYRLLGAVDIMKLNFAVYLDYLKMIFGRQI